MDNSTKIGIVTGTGAALNVSLGFVPDYVRLVNITDGNVLAEWFEGMSEGTAVRDTGTPATLAAPNGIATYLGSASQPRGFTIGATLSASGKQLGYVAIRTSSGV